MSEPVTALRFARVYDGRDEVGHPIVNRYPVDAGLREALLAYLEFAPTVSSGDGLGVDEFAPHDADVPLNYRTDGNWVWAGAVPHYLRKHGVPPDPELVQHIVDRRFQVGEVDGARQELAVVALATVHADSLTPSVASPEPGPLAPPESAPVDETSPGAAQPLSLPQGSAATVSSSTVLPPKNGGNRTIIVAAVCGVVAVLVSGFVTFMVLRGHSTAKSLNSTAAQTAGAMIPSVHDTVSLGKNPEFVVVEGNTVFVGDTNENSVWMLDAETHASKGVLPVAGRIMSMAANSKIGAVYVVIYDQGAASIDVIGTRKPSSPVVDTAISLGHSANRIAVDADANRAYVTLDSADYHGVATIDTSANTLLGTVGKDVLGGWSIDLAVNPLTHQVYVIVWGDKQSSLAVLDPNTRTVTASISLAYEGQRVALDPAAGLAYVLLDESRSPNDYIQVVSIKTNAPVRSVDLGKKPASNFLVADPDSHLVYFGMVGSPSGVWVLDTITNTVATTVGRGNSSYVWGSPGSVAVDSKTHVAYSTDQYSGKLVVLK